MDKDKKPEDAEKKEETPAKAEGAASGTESTTKPQESGADEKKDAEGESSDKLSDDKSDDKPAAKSGGLKQTLRRFWLYLVIILLIAIIGLAYVVVTGLQKKKTPPPPSVQSQTLTQDQLKQLKSTGISTSGQTLTVQGNAELDGQEAVRGNLNVAGDIQSGGTFSTPNLTLSNTGNFGGAQASSLQVATTATLSSATFQGGLNLAGNTSISNATVGTLTATKIIMSSNGDIAAQGHIALISAQNGIAGAIPHRTISFGVLGNGGAASISGSDTNGTVSIGTGSGPRPGCFITVIFLIPFPGPANILLGPIGLGSAGSQDGSGLHAYAQPITDPTTSDTTGFKICTATTPLANQAFGFSYLVNSAPN